VGHLLASMRTEVISILDRHQVLLRSALCIEQPSAALVSAPQIGDAVRHSVRGVYGSNDLLDGTGSAQIDYSRPAVPRHTLPRQTRQSTKSSAQPDGSLLDGRAIVPVAPMSAMKGPGDAGVSSQPFLRKSTMTSAASRAKTYFEGVATQSTTFGRTFEEEEDHIKKAHSKLAASRTLSEAATQGHLGALLHADRTCIGRWLEPLASALVILNVLFFGVEAEYIARQRETTEPEAFFYIHLCFTSCFVMELLTRVFVQGTGFFKDEDRGWNMFDTLIVGVSLLDFVAFIDGMKDKNFAYLRMVRVIKSIRVLRVLRILRIFRSLRLLVYSVLSTLRSLCWTMTLLVILLYMFGVVFTQATNEALINDDWEDRALRRYYGTVEDSVFTLFKSVTGGVDWEDVAKPLANLGPLWLVLFLIYLTFVLFAVLNVVTGVFCHMALESTQNDVDELTDTQRNYRKRQAQQLTSIFNLGDPDAKGWLTLQDFESLLDIVSLREYFESLEISCEDPWSLFKLLDLSGDGCIDLEEFVTGCMRLRGQAKSVDIAMLQYQLRWVTERLGKYTQFAEMNFANLNKNAASLALGPPKSSEQASSKDFSNLRGAKARGDSFCSECSAPLEKARRDNGFQSAEDWDHPIPAEREQFSDLNDEGSNDGGDSIFGGNRRARSKSLSANDHTMETLGTSSLQVV